MITATNIRPKLRTRGGVTRESTLGMSDTHNAEITPKESIRIFGVVKNHINGPQQYDRVFKIGDWAEYDSYNLSYNGTIIGIGQKTVTIAKTSFGNDSEVARLELWEFCDRNWNFDLAESHRRDAEWYD